MKAYVMHDYFDNRKPEPEPLRQSSRGPWDSLMDSAFIFKPNSRRGRKWRFRILCALAVLVGVFLYIFKTRTPTSDFDIDRTLRRNENSLLEHPKDGFKRD